MRPPRPLVLLFPTIAALLVAVFLLSGSPPAMAGEDDEPKKPDDAPADAPKEEEDPDDAFDGSTTFTPQQVDKAIERGVMYLRKKQDKSGSWGELSGGQAYGGGSGGKMYGHPAGPTALAVYTLLKCKVPLNDPAVKRGLEWLKKEQDKPAGSYETSMLLLALCATADTSKSTAASEKKKPTLGGNYRGWAGMLVDRLVEKKTGLTWRYQIPGVQAAPGGENDLSSTQLATLALFAANRVGLRVKASVWEDIIKFSMAQQDDDGTPVKKVDPVLKTETTWRARGFSYIKGQSDPNEGQATGGMTACGIANIMMARFVLSEGGRKQAEWNARPDAKKIQESVQDGLAWIEVNWSPFANPKKTNGNIYHLYWLYALERGMDLVGDKKIGEHFWYNEMGQQLLDRQEKDGHWKTGTTLEPGDVLDTCFALLFLRRATKGAIPFPSITGGSDEPPVDNR
jgi:hypothetical protein